MHMFLRKIQHALYLRFIRVMVAIGPGASHRAFLGGGSARRLCEHIARTGPRRVLVVTDRPLRELGLADRAIAALVEAGVDICWYDGVEPNPTFEQVAEGTAIARARQCDVVLGVGGGSSLDAAKLVAASATSDQSPRDWLGLGKVRHEVLTLYLIPTTAGTGSEATAGAVVTDTATHQKHVISGASLLPVAVAVDPGLMTGLPPHITAATGMDALTHGIEAYIGVWERGSRSQDARLAVKLIFDNLSRACHDGSNADARAGMATGAYYAGLAINQVNVGNVHAIAHQLGGAYGIPHGLANALVLPHVLEFCREEASQRLAELAVAVGLGEPGDDPRRLADLFIRAVRNLRTDIGIPDHSDLLRREDFRVLSRQAVAEGALYPVPRLLDEATVTGILQRIAA